MSAGLFRALPKRPSTFRQGFPLAYYTPNLRVFQFHLVSAPLSALKADFFPCQRGFERSPPSGGCHWIKPRLPTFRVCLPAVPPFCRPLPWAPFFTQIDSLRAPLNQRAPHPEYPLPRHRRVRCPGAVRLRYLPVPCGNPNKGSTSFVLLRQPKVCRCPFSKTRP